MSFALWSARLHSIYSSDPTLHAQFGLRQIWMNSFFTLSPVYKSDRLNHLHLDAVVLYPSQKSPQSSH